MNNILITGSRSSLSKKIIDLFSKEYNVIATNRVSYDNVLKMDVTNKNEIKKIFQKFKPDTVIHVATLTNPDYCEEHPEEAFLVNSEGTKNLIDICNQNIKFVYISTDYVFNGEKGNYLEDDRPNPINVYGKSKLQGEEYVKNSTLNHIIARVSRLYDIYIYKDSNKFMGWLFNSLKENKRISLFTDQIGTPTLTDDIANALMTLLKKDAKGMYHVVGPESLSLYQIGEKVAKIFNFDKSLITPTTSEGLKQIAKRPKDISLNSEKIKKEDIIMNDLETGLKIIKKELDFK